MKEEEVDEEDAEEDEVYKVFWSTDCLDQGSRLGGVHTIGGEV